MPIKNPDQPNKQRKSPDFTPILKHEIENAQAHTKSNMAAARFLGVPYLRYRKYAKLYGLFDSHMNQEGWGLDKGFSKKPNSIPLRDVLAGKHPKYSIAKLKNRLIARKKLIPHCYLCGFNEQRITDKTVPLMLHFKDGNRQNYSMENMELLCYNCFTGDTTFLTSTGLKTFVETVGTSQTVLCADGEWRPADIKQFGVQQTRVVELKPARHPHGRTRTHIRRTVQCTPDHRWITMNRGEVTDLRVGDIIPFAEQHYIPFNLEAWIRGFGFGDGTIGSAGRAQIRLCGEKDRVHLPLFEQYGNCSISYPPSTNGDPVIFFHKGHFSDWKTLPDTTDPTYLANWLQGYLHADAHLKADGFWHLSSQNAAALQFVEAIAPLAGYHMVGQSTSTTLTTNFGTRTSPLTTIHLSTTGVFRVTTITPQPPEPVYCAVEPVTHTFTLGTGAVTGNCMYLTTGAPSVAYRESIPRSFTGQGVKPVPKMTLRDSIPDADDEDEHLDEAPFTLEDRKQWLAELQNDT